jgi:hypothetical protein
MMSSNTLNRWYEEYTSPEALDAILNAPEDEFNEYVAEMIDYYRENPVDACYDVLGITLTEYQKVMIQKSWFSHNIYWCTSRGAGKSFIMAVLACLMAMLYPHQTVLMLGPSYRQSLLLYDKIMSEIYSKSFSLRYEITKTSRGTTDARIPFKNGSKILFLPMGDGDKIRGSRATIIFLDEDAQHDQQMIDRVVMPMAMSNLDFNPENPDLEFQPTVIRATSAYFQFNKSYQIYQEHLIKQNKDKDYYACTIPYELPLASGLYSRKYLLQKKSEMSSDDFDMEMGAKWLANNSGAFISVKAWDLGIKYKDHILPLMQGEKDKDYVLFCDIARSEGGDNASFLICEKGNSKLTVVRQMGLHGVPYQEQVVKVRKFVRDFNIVDIWIDKFGGGETIMDLLNDTWYDIDNGKEHLPIIKKDSEGNGLKLITPIIADNEMNHRMGHLTKKHIEKHSFIFPILTDRHDDPEIEMAFLDMIMIKKEVTNIQAVPSGQYHKFAPTKGTTLRKDRWTTFNYAAMYIEDVMTNKVSDEIILEIF